MTAVPEIAPSPIEETPIQWVRVTIDPNRQLSFGSGQRAGVEKSRKPVFGRRPLGFKVQRIEPPRDPRKVLVRGTRVSRGVDGDVVFRFDTQRQERIDAYHSRGFDFYKEAHALDGVARTAAAEGRGNDFAVARGVALDRYLQSSHLFERVINIDRTGPKARTASENLARLQPLIASLKELKPSPTKPVRANAPEQAPTITPEIEARPYESVSSAFGRSVTQGLDVLDTTLLRGGTLPPADAGRQEASDRPDKLTRRNRRKRQDQPAPESAPSARTEPQPLRAPVPSPGWVAPPPGTAPPGWGQRPAPAGTEARWGTASPPRCTQCGSPTTGRMSYCPTCGLDFMRYPPRMF